MMESLLAFLFVVSLTSLIVGSIALSKSNSNSSDDSGKVLATKLGGTGQTSYKQGDILVGNESGGLSKLLLTSGTNVAVTEGVDSVTIDLPTNLQNLNDVSSSYFTRLGSTGATSSSRYVGATTGGSPTSGTFNVGDYVVDQTGKIWICTTAGSPGTWTQVGSGGGSSGPTLPTNVENYSNTNPDGFPANMRPTADIGGNGTGLLLLLNSLPSGLSPNTTTSITVNNSNITALSQIFFTPMIANTFMGGPLLDIFLGNRSLTSFTLYVRNADTIASFSNSWSMSVLIVNPTTSS